MKYCDRNTLFYNSAHGHCIVNQECVITRGFQHDDRNFYNVTYSAAFRQWRKKRSFLLAMGMAVISKWECEYTNDRKSPDMQEFLRIHYQDGRPSDRLAKRSGLKGGRVESFKLKFHFQLDSSRELHYVDKNSLYPHSAIINGN